MVLIPLDSRYFPWPHSIKFPSHSGYVPLIPGLKVEKGLPTSKDFQQDGFSNLHYSRNQRLRELAPATVIGSLLQVSRRCFHTLLKASPEGTPAKTAVEARKVYPELAEGFIIQKLPLSSRIVRPRKSIPP